jgi:DNA-binding transcriptional MerR regulator
MQRTQTLLPIGRFSRLCGLTVKALRHYDDIGLLEPAHIDEGTGYRYYALAQLDDAVAISRLRALHVPLDECREILAEHDTQAIRARLERHRKRLEGRLSDTQRTLAALAELLKDPASLLPPGTQLEKVEVKEVDPQPVLAMRSRTTADDLDAVISKSINGVADYMAELDAKRAGPPFTQSSDPDGEGAIDVVIGWPTGEPLPGGGDVQSLALPGGKVAWAVYHGSYLGLPGAYRALYEWLDEQGHEAGGDPREIYYTDPDEVAQAEDNVTGIVWPLQS